MKLKTTALTLVLGVTASPILYAEQVYIFEQIDKDHNGAISMEEAMIREDLTKDFAMIDSDGSGSLSVDEYSSYMNKGRLAPEDYEIPEPGAAPVR